MTIHQHDHEQVAPTRTDAAAVHDRKAGDLADPVIARLTDAARQRRRRLQIVVSLPIVLLLMVPILMDQIPRAQWLVPSVCSLLLFLVLIVSRRYGRTVDALAERDDVRLIGPLTDAMAVQGDDIGAVAAVHVADLLPRLRPEDARLLNDAQRRMLDAALLERRDPVLALAILAAYAVIGDAKSLPVVEKLAAGEGRLGRDPRVREAAVECLPHLRARAQAEQAAQTLLRPASAPDGGETLLRPASGPAEADPSVLLRPSELE